MTYIVLTLYVLVLVVHILSVEVQSVKATNKFVQFIILHSAHRSATDEYEVIAFCFLSLFLFFVVTLVIEKSECGCKFFASRQKFDNH